MKIESFKKNAWETYIICERYINNGSPSGFVNSTSDLTSPWSLNTSFDLLQFKNTTLEIKDFGDVSKNIIPDGCIFVHPDMYDKDSFKKLGFKQVNSLNVFPTASGRTVMTSDFSSFVKLSYLKQIGRVTRTLDSRKIKYSIGQSKYLEKIANEKQVNSRFCFLREVFGRVVILPNEKGDDKKELGYIIRESKPYPQTTEKEYLVPFFSLFADSKNTQINLDLPIIVQMINRQNKMVEDFLLEDIIYPLYHTYFDALIFAGIGIDGHGQNILLSLDENFLPKRIVLRDLDSSYRDKTLMDFLNIKYKQEDMIEKFIFFNEQSNDYSDWHKKHSFYFDFKLGEYIVTPLLSVIKNYFKEIDINELQQKIKQYNARFINKLPKDYFPQKWCSIKSINNEDLGIDMQYEWHSNPKYR